MTLYLYFILIFLNLIFAYRKRSSKLLTICTLVFIFLLMSGSGVGYESFNHSNDYINYKFTYESIGPRSLFQNPQVGYTILMKIGNLLHLDFFTFRLLIIAICLLLIYIFIIRRYADNHNYVLIMYMIYPMIADSEQLRNYIALTVLFYAIRFLEINTLKNKVKFTFFILIAVSFHTAFIFYLVLLLANANNKSKLVKSIAIVTVCLCIIAFLNNNTIPFLSIFLSLIDNEKAIDYLTTKTRYGFLIPFALHTINFFMISWARKIYKSNSIYKDYKTEASTLNYIQLIFWLNTLSFAFFPLYMLSITFYRLSRNLLILNFVAYSKASSIMNQKHVKKFVFNLAVIFSILFWLLLDLTYKTSAERVLIPFFTENYFFNK